MEFDFESSILRMEQNLREMQIQDKLLDIAREEMFIRSAQAIWEAQRLIDRINKRSD